MFASSFIRQYLGGDPLKNFVENEDGFLSYTGSGVTPTANADILAETGPLHSIAPSRLKLSAVNLTGWGDTENTGSGYDPTFANVRFTWTIDGNPLPSFTKPLNIYAVYNNPNIAYGKFVDFCFPNAGTYTIRLNGIDLFTGAVMPEKTYVHTVGTPAQGFSAANTIAFALDGDFTGAPAANTQVTSVSALQSAIQATTAPTRITCKPGENVDNFHINPGNGYLSHFDTWTPGSTTTLNIDLSNGEQNAFFFGSGSPDTQVVFRDLVVNAGWDVLTGRGIEGGLLDWNLKTNTFWAVFHNVDVNGAGFAFNLSSTGIHSIMLNDCSADAPKHYALYSFSSGGTNNEQGNYAIRGFRSVQNPEALSGADKLNLMTDHGAVIRLERYIRCFLDIFDVFNHTGWSGTPPRAANATLRLGSKGPSNMRNVVTRGTLEGGYIQFKYDGENNTAPDRPHNMLAEFLLLIGTCRSIGFAGVHFGGTIMRNILAIMPNVALYPGPGGISNFAQIEPDNNQTGNLNAPLHFYNITAVNLSSAGSMVWFFNPTLVWADLRQENNILVSNSSDPDLANLDTTNTLPGVTPRFSTIQWPFDNVVVNQTTAPGGTITIPYANIGRQDELGNGPAGGTTQAYWQTAQSAGNNQHMITVNNTTRYSEVGHFSVSYADPTNLVITNTSGVTWTGDHIISLDRTVHLDADLPPITSFASPSTLPALTPLSGSPNVTTGLVADLDALLNTRNDPTKQGAREAA